MDQEEEARVLDKQRLRTFVLGGIAGALAGILLAPRSGKDLRGSIASRAGEARERSRETYFDAQERARERFAEARDRPPSRTADPAPENVAGPAAGPRPVEPPPSLGTPPEEPLAQEPLAEQPPPDLFRDPQPLRDVSRDVSDDVPAASGEDSEDLRRRIRETRSRIRERLDGEGRDA